MSHKKFGPDRFSRFDVYWIQTDRKTDRQAKFMYRLRLLSFHFQIFFQLCGLTKGCLLWLFILDALQYTENVVSLVMESKISKWRQRVQGLVTSFTDFTGQLPFSVARNAP